MNRKTLLVVLLLLQPLLAQRLEEELARCKRDLQAKQGEVERLLHARMDHDMGTNTPDALVLGSATEPVTTEWVERTKKQLAEEEARVLTLLDRQRRMQTAIDAAGLQVKVTLHAQATPQVPEVTLEIPAVGSSAPLVRETNPATSPINTNAALPPVVAEIDGSADHLRIAQTLHAAALQLLDQAEALRTAGRAEAAAELELRAKERLTRARGELQPLVASPEATYAALYCEGRCLELLFRHSERHEGLTIDQSAQEYQRREAEVRDPFLRISARDVVPGVAGAAPTMGTWGLAAQTVLEHFRWLNVHKGYRPKVDIASLQWSRAKQ